MLNTATTLCPVLVKKVTELHIFFEFIINNLFLAAVKENSGVTAGPSYYADNTVNGSAGSKH